MSKKEKMLQEQRDQLLAFYGYFVQICIYHVQGTMAAIQTNDSLQREIVNFSMIYNTHSIVNFMLNRIQKMHVAVKMDESNTVEMLKEWTELFKEKILPAYDIEVARIKEVATNKGNTKSPTYVS